jgi:Phospholipase_D-nuclease N-terminal
MHWMNDVFGRRMRMLAFLVGVPGCELACGLIVVVTSVFWIWMLVDCLTNEAIQGTDKIVWVLVIIFVHFLGALIYYFVKHEPKRPR